MNSLPKMPETISIGGLMRCCTGTWNQEMIVQALRDWQDGETIQCQYAKDDPTHRMVRVEGVWRWDHPPIRKKEA